jgi:apolipoprotein N-acyltransferase
MPKKIWFLAFLSGVLLALSWYDLFPGYLLHLALVPLLIAEDFIYERKNIFSSRLVFLIAYLTFFTWNICTLWWVIKISFIGALFTVSANSMLYAIVFWAYYLVKRKTGRALGFIALLFFWLAFEFYSLHAEFALPWLILGNGLVNNISAIQWYEYTGSLGGSLWVLLGNLSVYGIYQCWNRQNYSRIVYSMLLFVVLICIPCFFSSYIYHHTNENGLPCKVAIIQPNIDPYTEKFNSLSQNAQLGRILNLADSIKDGNVDYYLAPETAIDNDIWENNFLNNYSLFAIRNFISLHPHSRFIIGAITYREYPKNEEIKVTARFDPASKRFFDVFNSAIQIDTSFNTSVYHKSKLVLGVEKVPFPAVFRFFDKYLLKLGGSTGSLGQQKEPTVFSDQRGIFRPAPVICFESIFGEYNTEYIKRGANLIFIITNDGWWHGTIGYKQHFKYSQLRAIETRRAIARCANTGISAFINQKGEVIQATHWWKQTTLVETIQTNDRLTFYTRHGDYIGRIAVALSALIIVFAFVSGFRKKVKKRS